MSATTLAPLLAVIPARIGSRRVARKNIRPLAGRPALAYTVEAALGAELFGQVVVSTDSEEIAALATSLGASVPFLRDAALADDQTHVSAVTLDALVRVDTARSIAAVAQLLPNCPLRTAEDIRSSWNAFEQGGTAAQLSVARFGWQNPWWASTLARDGTLRPLFSNRMTERSQDLPPLVSPTGAVWWIRADVLRRTGTFHVPGRTGWEMPWQRAVDIDNEDDWALAELLLRAGRRRKVRHAE
ncbi:MAG TPA: acylneuraminate cytidylyltransferase family protein [Gemmatimonadales bacterium]|jgi:N-acylneuraminate cytidylyltransferase|nr:acylneuraminate cytidylyltransferase family protein [Gemmatimonadales bacterium]